MHTFVMHRLRVVLVVLLLGSVLGRVLVPAFASQAAKTFLDVGYLVVPYSLIVPIRPSGDVAAMSAHSPVLAGRWPISVVTRTWPWRRPSVYAKCMAVKTITIDLDAYERLARLKRSNQSFSQVIKEHLPAAGATASDLLARLDETSVSDGTLERIEHVIDERGRHPVRVPEW